MKAFPTSIVLALLLLATAASGQPSKDHSSRDRSAETEPPSTFGITPLTQELVTRTIQAEMLEVQSSQLALMRAGSDKAKDFAHRTIEDREAANELKALVSAGQVRAIEPLFLGKRNAEQIERLWTLPDGPEFTHAYKDLQVSLHQDAVSLFERYARDGDSSELKLFAAKHLPALREQLQAAEELER